MRSWCASCCEAAPTRATSTTGATAWSGTRWAVGTSQSSAPSWPTARLFTTPTR
jgi:hypothetical protein